MNKRTYDFLNNNNLIFSSQYGFQNKHSCENAVQELIGNVIKNKEINKSTIAIYLELSKAFHTISHNVLLKKLGQYGIRGKAYDWFEHYLSERKMHTKCNAGDPPELCYSSYYDLSHGTLQGSCLGPLLFKIYVNDLHLQLEHCHCILFADDTTIYYSHQNTTYLEWCLNEDMNNLSDWFKVNELTLNISKTVGMLFFPRKNWNPCVRIDGLLIPFMEYMTYLGIWIDNALTWQRHINKIYMKIKQNTSLLRNSCYILDLHCKRMLFYAQIQSHINYGLGLWGPMVSSSHLGKLQKAHENCLKLVYGCNDI